MESQAAVRRAAPGFQAAVKAGAVLAGQRSPGRSATPAGEVRAPPEVLVGAEARAQRVRAEARAQRVREARVGSAVAAALLSNACMPADASSINAISAGTTHTCVLTNAGSVRCWGENGFGELGDGTTP